MLETQGDLKELKTNPQVSSENNFMSFKILFNPLYTCGFSSRTGLHCLPKYLFKGFQNTNGNKIALSMSAFQSTKCLTVRMKMSFDKPRFVTHPLACLQALYLRLLFKLKVLHLLQR